MNATSSHADSLAAKITRRVEERGWNQEDFARITKLNRQTIRQILLNQGRKPHNATVQACARALGLTVSELRELPLERLLPRMHGQTTAESEEAIQRVLDRATLPEFKAWLQRNRERLRALAQSELEELFELQDNGGMAAVGVDRCIELIERRRRLLQQVRDITRSEYLDFLERFVGLLHERVQPPTSS